MAEFSLDPVFRTAILTATSNPAVASGVNQYGMQLGAARFVGGETFEECLDVLKEMTAQGFLTNTSILGEAVNDETVVEAITDEYLTVLDTLAAEGLKTHLSIKLTQIGLDIDEELSFQNVTRLVQRAADHGTFIRIAMEESPTIDATLKTYRRLREDGFENTGVVLQTYLFRSQSDLRNLLEYRPNIRLVKGAYLEPPEVAYQEKAEVDVNFLKMVKRSLSYGEYTAVATHDDRIIDYVLTYAERNDIAPESYEFQMLYGIRPQYQRELVEAGHRVRVAVPYGPDWYLYLMRRLAERPANVLFLFRNLIRD